MKNDKTLLDEINYNYKNSENEENYLSGYISKSAIGEIQYYIDLDTNLIKDYILFKSIRDRAFNYCFLFKYENIMYFARYEENLNFEDMNLYRLEDKYMTKIREKEQEKIKEIKYLLENSLIKELKSKSKERLKLIYKK